jgi:lysophospholipase L1-like esterase
VVGQRICFFGDSFVHGIGDPERRGWVGRVLAATPGDVTGFNLGIRRNTSEDVLRRCWPECAERLIPGEDNRLVLSFGSNDAIDERGGVRVRLTHTLENLGLLLDGCRRRAVEVLVVGPPPVIGAGPPHLERLLELAGRMRDLCELKTVPFADVTQPLAGDATWRAEALAGDGAHPAAGGYDPLAARVREAHRQPWLDGWPDGFG